MSINYYSLSNTGRGYLVKNGQYFFNFGSAWLNFGSVWFSLVQLGSIRGVVFGSAWLNFG
jgi:hypothetical protein